MRALSRKGRAAGVAAAAMLMLGLSPAQACSASQPCRVADGIYFVRTPDGWDGRSKLPAVVFMHGYGGSAEEIMADEALRREVSESGAMLVAPQGRTPEGRSRTWSFPGKVEPGRDDVAFIEAVAADVARRFPVDADRLVASGFSLGGSMAWTLACNGHGRFAAYAPVAGAFWVPEAQDCPAGPQSLRHIHGTADRTVPMTGRKVGPGWQQGDVMRSVATWRRVDGCSGEPLHEAAGRLACQRWPAAACSSGRELVLCLHGGEHEMEARWVGDAIRWADALARLRPPAAAAVR